MINYCILTTCMADACRAKTHIMKRTLAISATTPRKTPGKIAKFTFSFHCVDHAMTSFKSKNKVRKIRHCDSRSLSRILQMMGEKCTKIPNPRCRTMVTFSLALGLSRSCSATFEQLFGFGATFSPSSNFSDFEHFFPF